MFGFLKKKLQEAVSKFTGKAKEELSEEKVKDASVIEAAKREEQEILAKEAAVKVIPELPKEQAQHEKEAKEKKAPPAPKPTPKPQIPVKKPAPKERKETLPKEVEQPLPPVKEEPEPLPAKQEPVEAAPPVQETESAKPTEKKGFLGIFKKKEPKAAEPVPKEPEPAPPEQIAPPTPITETVKERKGEIEKKAAEPVEEPAEPTPSKGLLSRLKESFTKKTLSPEKFEELFWELEVVLLENNVALEVIEKLKADLKQALTSGKVSRLGIEDLILVSLKESVREVLDIPGFDLIKRVKESSKRPYVIAFIGVNGSGKTTTLAKVANHFQQTGLGVVMAASDTFRAAAIDQLKEHADRLGIKLISQGYGADPAAVAFDAVEHAKAKQIDVVMIDTAGRLHSNTNLMAELQKVMRVAKPDLKIFIGESITGNDCVEQAKEFDKLVGIDAIILSKADVDEKGGAALSVSYVTKRPILYLGVGQSYGDLKPFDKEQVIRSLGL